MTGLKITGEQLSIQSTYAKQHPAQEDSISLRNLSAVPERFFSRTFAWNSVDSGDLVCTTTPDTKIERTRGLPKVQAWTNADRRYKFLKIDKSTGRQVDLIPVDSINRRFGS